MFLFIIFIFIISLIIGSFFNVIIDRIYRDEQFINGRSYCEKCKHELAPRDLIPIFSYISLKGKCRYCKERIPFFLNITELLTATVFSISLYWLFNKSNFIILNDTIPSVSTIEFVIFTIGFIILIGLLLLTFLIDLKYQIIPDVFLYGILFIYLLGFILYKLLGLNFAGYSQLLYEPILFHILAGLIMFVFFGALHVGFKGKAMGEGDIYLSAILALFLGLPTVIIMWFGAFLSGALIGVILIVLNLKSIKSKIAFGPFLIFGFVIALLFGIDIWNLYIGLF